MVNANQELHGEKKLMCYYSALIYNMSVISKMPDKIKDLPWLVATLKKKKKKDLQSSNPVED